jgi:membrane protein
MKSTHISEALAGFPWRDTALTLRERYREHHLNLTAGSLTFTTMLSLVPVFTVILAIFTAFPMFSRLQDVLQKWLVESLIPENIARQVLGYLSQFSSKASQLGLAGLVIVLITALALVLTIDRTLNTIWRVRRPRPLAHRVLIYWGVITLGPLVLGASLATTSYLLSVSSSAVGSGAGGLRFMLDGLEFAMLTLGMAALYRFVPNTDVAWAHAAAGGLVVAIGIEVAKKLLTLYLAAVPTYSAVYGAFATFPILLLWVYVVWLIVLVGAVLAACLPSLLAGSARRAAAPGLPFQLALEVIQALHLSAGNGHPGVTWARLASTLKVERTLLESVVDVLIELGWVGLLEPSATAPRPRLILLANIDQTRVGDLVARLLISPCPPVQKFWDNAHLSTLNIREALG